MGIFKVKRNRDAYAAIKGFVYQVDMTIERWLELQADEILELERGEDIDVVQRALQSGNYEESQRRLEQIKERNNNLTLGQPYARSALAFFYEHYQENANKNLVFRYITNANTGIERSTILPTKLSLISAWQQVYGKSIDDNQTTLYVRAIGAFLNKSKKPEELNEETWNLFKDFIKNSTDGTLLKFIRKVEWLTLQTEHSEMGDRLRQKIIEQYNLSNDKAQIIYWCLFSYVFKVLTRDGLKQLAVRELHEQIASPIFNANDQALFNRLTNRLQEYGIKIEKIEKRLNQTEAKTEENATKITSLEQTVSEQNYVSEIDFGELHEACRQVTLASAKQIIDQQKTIVREQFRAEVQDFIIRDLRYNVTVGVSGVGKSMALATEALHLLSQGWTVLLFALPPGNNFTLNNYAAKQVKRQIPHEPQILEWFQIVKPWQSDNQEHLAKSKGLIILLDGLEATDPEHLSTQLTDLHGSVATALLQNVKIIISSRNLEFERFLQNQLSPFLVKAEDWRDSNRGYMTSEIVNFTTSELDEALMAIGATELLFFRDPNDKVDSHLTSIRELLRHPGTFEHYANLRKRGDILSVQEETWSSLIERRFKYVLEDVARQTRLDSEELRKDLINFTDICRHQKAREFSLNYEQVRNEFPAWFHKREKTSITTYAAFLSCGVLFEQSAANDEKQVAFRVSDAGAYLLSFELEREIRQADPEKLQEVIKEWLDESWNFSPSTDAILALIDRLSILPYSPELFSLLEVLLNSHQNFPLFNLMRPTVLGALFTLLKKNKPEDYYSYIEAAMEVRFSTQNLELIRRHLRNRNSNVRRLAIKLTGLYRIVEFTPELIHLLGNEDREVSIAAYNAVGKIGEPAINCLLETVDDNNNPADIKRNCITALRNIGFRSENVSLALSNAFSFAMTSSETDLLRAILLTSAHLRDQNQIQFAITALEHSNKEVAVAAAKYLTELPSEKAYEKLHWRFQLELISEEDGLYDDWLLNQIIAALLKINREKTEKELQTFLKQGLEGKSKFYPMQIVRLIENHNLDFGYSLIFKELVDELKMPLPHNNAWRFSKLLASAWQPDSLALMVNTAHSLQKKSIDVAKIFVEAIAPNMREHDVFPMGDRLNRTEDLLPLMKSQAKNFVPETLQLLKDASKISTKDLCRYLWIVGDTSAEKDLMLKFNQIPDEEKSWYVRDAVLRALGTCGTKRGAKMILSYLRTTAEITLAFPRECLFPLLQRKMIRPELLVDLCKHSKNNHVGRAVSLLALAELDAPSFTELFIENTKDESKLVQMDAVIALGFTKAKDAVTVLRELLQSDSSSGLKAYAAQALQRLDAKEAVPDIEDALLECEEDERNDIKFLNALSYFRVNSTISILLERLQTASRHTRRYYLEALASFSSEPQIEKRIFNELENSSLNYSDYFGEQQYLLSGITWNENNSFFKHIDGQLKVSRLTDGARMEVAFALPRLFKNQNFDRELFSEIIKRLICDHSVAVRDRVMHTLDLLPIEFCQQIYQDLLNNPEATEWTRACAVESLGFWDSDLLEINTRKYDEQLLVRQFADKAIIQKNNRSALKFHLSQFEKTTGLSKLSAYLCLAEHGNLSSIRSLHEMERKKTETFAFISHLTHQINERRRKEMQDSQKTQDEQQTKRGFISFD